MKRFLLLATAWLFGISAGFAQPDFNLDSYFGDCDCPMVNEPPICAEVAPGIVVALPSICFAECMGLTVIEGGDCSMGWGGDFDWYDDDSDDDDDDWGDWDGDYGDWGDEYGDWNDSTWTGDWDDDFDWNDSTWTGDWGDDYGDWDDDFDWNDSTWTGNWDDDYGDWNDSTWTGGDDFPGGVWTDSIDLGGDLDFDLLDSLLNDWLANGGQDIVDSLLNDMANGDPLLFPPFPGDLNLDSLLASGDFSWLDSLLVGGGLGDFPWGDPGFPGGGLDSLLGDIDWNEVDSILNPGGLPWSGLDVDVDPFWEEKGPGEEFDNFGSGNSRNGTAWTESPVEFQCYPVPANDRLFVQVSGKALRLELWSLAGQRLRQENLTTAGTTTIDVAHLAAGTYFIRLQDEIGNWNQKTVIIQR
jgi:hypothetical protein